MSGFGFRFHTWDFHKPAFAPVFLLTFIALNSLSGMLETLLLSVAKSTRSTGEDMDACKTSCLSQVQTNFFVRFTQILVEIQSAIDKDVLENGRVQTEFW